MATDGRELMLGMMERTSDSVLVTTVAGIVLYVNPAFERMTGYETREALGKTPGALLKSGHHDVLFYRELWEAILSGQTFRATFVNRRKNGSLYNENRSIVPIVTSDRGVTHFLAIGREAVDARSESDSAESPTPKTRAPPETPSRTAPRPELVFRFRPDGVLTDVNEACLEFAKISRDEMLGGPFARFVHPDDLEGFRSRVRALTLERPVCSGETRVMTPDGEARILAWACRGFFDPNGEPEEYQGVARDVTDREGAIESLRRSEERFSKIFHALPVPTAISTPEDGRFLDVNPSFLDLVGLPREEVVGRTSKELGLWLHPRQRDHLMRRLAEGKGPVRNEPLSVRVRSGEIREGLGSFDTVELEGQPRVLSHFHDLTGLRQTERALHESETRNRAMIAAMPDMIFLLDHEGHFLDYHAPDPETLFLPPEEFLHRRQQDLLPPELAQQVETTIRTLVETGEPQRLEYAAEIKGRLLEFEARFAPSGDNRILEIIRDITERKQTERNLAKFALAISQSFDGIAIADLEGTIVFANNAWANLHGYDDPQQLLGSHIALFHSKERMEREVLPFNVVVMREGANNGVIWHKRRDGTEFPSRMSGALLRDETGQPVGLVGIMQDITDHLQALKALKESETYKQAIFDSMPDMIFLLDREGVFLDCHASDPERFFLSPDQFLGRNQRDVLPSELAEQTAKAMEDIFATRKIQVFEYVIDHHGIPKHYEARFSPCGDDHVLGIVRDITEEKSLREQLIAGERMVAIGQVAATAAHNMRNIFTALKGSVSLLGRAIDSGNTASARQAHRLLDKSTIRLQVLFMEMLDYSRQRVPHLKPVEMVHLLQEVADLLRLIDTKSALIEFRVEPDSEIEMLDRDWMHRCLVNLGINALDAVGHNGTILFRAYRRAPDARPTVAFTPAPIAAVSSPLPTHSNAPLSPTDDSATEGPAAPRLVVEITDNGCGISEEVLSKLFRPLFTTKQSHGTGLGLVCVQQFIETMGGWMEVESRPKNGATFRLVLPGRAALLSVMPPISPPM